MDIVFRLSVQTAQKMGTPEMWHQAYVGTCRHNDMTHIYTYMWAHTNVCMYTQAHVYPLSSLSPCIVAPSFPPNTHRAKAGTSALTHVLPHLVSGLGILPPYLGFEVFWGKNGACSSLGLPLSRYYLRATYP